MTDLVIIAAVVVGTVFMLLGSLGLYRLQDFYLRIHPPTKTTTFGLFFLLIAVAVAVPEADVITKVMLAVLFVALTAPVSAHLLFRAAYRRGVPWELVPDPDEYRPVADRHRCGPAPEAEDEPGEASGR